MGDDERDRQLPGQVWLWLYTFWYQIKPFSTSANADILVMAVMGVLSLAFILIPFLPGVSDLPRRIPIYKLIWRDHYRAAAAIRLRGQAVPANATRRSALGLGFLTQGQCFAAVEAHVSHDDFVRRRG